MTHFFGKSWAPSHEEEAPEGLYYYFPRHLGMTLGSFYEGNGMLYYSITLFLTGEGYLDLEAEAFAPETGHVQSL